MNSVGSYHFTPRLPNPPGDIHILGSVVRYKPIRTQSSSFIFYFPLAHQLQEKKKEVSSLLCNLQKQYPLQIVPAA